MTPFKTNEQLNIDKKNKEEKQNAQNNATELKNQMTGESLLELKINHPQQMNQNTGQTQNQIYPSPYIPVPNPYYPLIANPTIPWQYTQNNVPIIKKYNISLGNANGDITKIASLYEDILPSEGNITNNTFNTIKERMIIHHYIRSIFIKIGDGEELLINGNANQTKSEITNLLSHLKLLEINPYHYSKQTDNIYKTLPENFVMYRSCYPIKLGQNNSIECSKSSIGMNIRIYLLSKFDDGINKIDLSRYKSDVWRELDYYQYIRDEVIKQNISPNFISLHSYYMTKNTGINFKKFNQISSIIENKNNAIAKMNYNLRNNLYKEQIIQMRISDDGEIVKNEDIIKEGIRIPTEISESYIVSANDRKQVITKRVERDFKNNAYNRSMDSDKCLVMLSEASTQHLLNWGSRAYHTDNGPVRKMIQNGYHDEKVWGSMFFQLLLSMLIMFDKKIMFTEFSLKNNVFIKDLKHSEQSVGIWKYIFNGIDYYVPNYGYLLLIDSNYAEINEHSFSFSKKDEDEDEDEDVIQYRIKSELMNDSNKRGEIYRLCIDRMIHTFNSNNFNNEFTNYGGIKPGENFLNFLETIKNKLVTIKSKYLNNVDEDIDIEKHNNINKSMKDLPLELICDNNCIDIIHSRVGTQVRDQEKAYIAEDFNLNTKYGSIICIVISNTLFKFALYLGQYVENGVNICRILTINQELFETNLVKNFIIQEKERGSIRNYYTQPDHIYEPGKQFNILETYLISLNT
jgi:hypothetical protein